MEPEFERVRFHRLVRMSGRGLAGPMSSQGILSDELVMAAAKKRRSADHDFTVKENDVVEVRTALTIGMGDFRRFLQSLTAPQFEEFQSFVMRNKNMDRIVEYTVSQMAVVKALDLYHETHSAYITARYNAGRAKVEKSVEDLFATNFLTKSGRWDVEGLKITLAEFNRDADRMAA